jgi:UDP-glucose 4-epimerase
MRVVITGATGNVGSALVRALQRAREPAEIIGVVRRPPPPPPDGTRWYSADVAHDDLIPAFDGADVVIHLAWAIQPSHDEALMRRVNVTGTERVLDAVRRAGVPALVHGSSVGAYSPAPKHQRTTEDWPTHGVETSAYSRQKAYCERLVDRFEASTPEVRVVRLRPGLIFQEGAGSEIRRLFLGPLFPSRLIGPTGPPVIPDIPGIAFQAVHADDVADAYRLAATTGVRGAFNIAAPDVLTPRSLAEALGRPTVPVPLGTARRVVEGTWRLRLQPTPPGWLDLAASCPVMDTGGASEELGWSPSRSGTDAVRELLAGLRSAGGTPTPPLRGGGLGRLRSDELRTGVGGRREP